MDRISSSRRSAGCGTGQVARQGEVAPCGPEPRSGGISRSIGLLLVAVLPALAGRAAEPVGAAPLLPAFRIDPQGFGDSEADIRAVLESACRELWRHFPDDRIEPFVVIHGRSGPITLFERNERREIVIQLDTGGRFWCQYAYQFAHEFCHVLCGARPGDRSHLWFEETLCETASLYVIRGMARSWRTDAPYPHWRDYRDALGDYADQTMRRWPRAEEIARDGLAAFHARHESRLLVNPVDRDLNGAMAGVLLRCFEETPEHWRAVRWLADVKAGPARTFAAHLAAWHAAVPDRHRAFVARIAALFGQPIDAGRAAAP